MYQSCAEGALLQSADLPRDTVTLHSSQPLDVLVLARGQKQAEGILAAGLPEGAKIKYKAGADKRRNHEEEATHDVLLSVSNGGADANARHRPGSDVPRTTCSTDEARGGGPNLRSRPGTERPAV